ncbi:MAG: P1 family peptidase [Filifactoraceae bacterium]
MREISCNELKKIRIGNAQNFIGGSGCTVIICEDGAVAGVDVRGSAPATRETDALDPKNVIDSVHGIVLSGGSAYGLEACCGVMKYLEERGKGFDVGVGVVPIVCGASIFDLNIGEKNCRPNISMGYDACLMSEKGNYKDGCYGAGTGATVGKVAGSACMMKSGIGSYFIEIGKLKIGAIIVVNAFGDVYDKDGKFIAGFCENGERGISTQDVLLNNIEKKRDFFRGNTTIGCIITNAKLTKAQCCKLSGMGHDGFARVIKPVHTSMDGDCIFTMATEEVEVNNIALESIAADVVEEAVIRAVKSATSMFGINGYSGGV